MSAPNWIQRIRNTKEITDRKKFWKRVVPQAELVKVDEEDGTLGLHIESFQLNPTSSFADAREDLPEIRKTLGIDNACLCPSSAVTNPHDGNSGVVIREGFHLIWSESKRLPSIFDMGLTQRERDFITRIEVIPMLSDDVKIGYCPLLHTKLANRNGSPEVVISIISKKGTRLEDFGDIKNFLIQKYDARLVEFLNEGESDSSMMVSIIISTEDPKLAENANSFIETGTIPVAKGLKDAETLTKGA